jgi:hypothetical protein
MSRLFQSLRAHHGQNWQDFLWYILAFLLAGSICSILPTPGSWSDGRSQWVPAAALAPVAAALFVVTFRIYRRSGTTFKIQAVILWAIFGATLMASAFSLYDSVTFLREVRANFAP